MRRFHIVGLNDQLTHTLAIRTAAGWILPWLDDDPQIELPIQVEAMLNRMTSHSELIHEAPLTPSSRPSPTMQGYCCALVWRVRDTTDSAPVGQSGVVLVPNDELASTAAVLPVQRQAWLLATARLSTPTADFDSASRVAETLQWTEQMVERTGAQVLSLVRHRCSRHEYVVRAQTTSGVMYLKAGMERVADEGVLTGLLSSLDLPKTRSPAFPQTIAIDTTRGRWLYRELPGELIVGPLLTASNVIEAVAALASLQRCAATSSVVREHLFGRCLIAVDLFTIADRIVGGTYGALLEESSADDVDDLHRLIDSWQSMRGSILAECGVIDRLGLPLTIVLSDFWPRNILATRDGIGFIDLERSYWSLPCLSLWRLERVVERVLGRDRSMRDRINSTFVAGWDPVVTPLVMWRALAALPLLGALFGVLMVSQELDLQERDIGSRLPSGYRLRALSHGVSRVIEASTGVDPR